MAEERYYSETILKRKEKNIAGRTCLKAIGYTDYELEGRPVIGIANAWNTLVPGHANLKELAEHVKNGIYAAGGTAVEFGVIAGCDGLAIHGESMNCVLPSRELICDAIEIQTRMSFLDGLVLMGSCDKIIPGMLMAAARLDIPAILINGGPMQGGRVFDGRKADQTTPDEAYGMYLNGKISEEALWNLERTACPGVGSCAFLGTANSMACVAEALGMMLPGSALIPAVYANRKHVAFESGRAVCHLVNEGITPGMIMTENAVNNAVKLASTISASTNTVIHLSAIAHELELTVDVTELFRQAREHVPQIVKVNPAAQWDMEDFYKAGGMPRVMENMMELLDGEVLTVTGRTIQENVASYRFDYPSNEDIIRSLQEPFGEKGGIAILKGNLAPDTAVSKPGAIHPSCYRFEGSARVYDSEEEANAAILNDEIHPGDVVVVRYEGPKGGPGMREMYLAMKYLYGKGLGKTTALITDGRFSGTNNGCFVGHISPEAAEGGPIAIVEDGDQIIIDVIRGQLELRISRQEMKRRLENWKAPQKSVSRGYLRRYMEMVTSAGEGAVLKSR